MELPESLRFLGGLWWLLHLVSIGLVLYVGYVIGRSEGEAAARRELGGTKPPPAEEEPEPRE
jgi:hypothetical protein